MLREHCRYIEKEGCFAYKLKLSQVVECHLELVAGNGYSVLFSKDGKNWHEELNANQIRTRDDEKVADAAWFRIVDITKYLNSSGNVYMKFTNSGNMAAYDGHGAFLRRLTIYGVFNSNEIYIRFANGPYGPEKGFALSKFTMRHWRK